VNLDIISAELRLQRPRINEAISALEGSLGSSAPQHGRPPKATAVRVARRGRMSGADGSRKR
jgi:hypothetical protein